MTPRYRLGVSATVVAVALWAVGSALAKKVALPGEVLSMHRVGWAAVVYLVVLGARRCSPTRAKLRLAVWVGVCYALTNVLFFVGVKETTVANATIILALQPVPIMVVSNRMFGEAVRRREMMLSAVSLAGVALVVFGSSTTVEWSLLGDLLCVGSLVAWTGYFVATKALRSKMGAVELQANMLPTSTVILFVIALGSGDSLSPGGPSQWAGIAAIIATAGTGHLLLSWASPHVPIAQASLLTLGQPLVAVALAALFLDEAVVGWQLVGMGVVLAAMAAVVLSHQQHAGLPAGTGTGTGGPETPAPDVALTVP